MIDITFDDEEMETTAVGGEADAVHQADQVSQQQLSIDEIPVIDCLPEEESDYDAIPVIVCT